MVDLSTADFICNFWSGFLTKTCVYTFIFSYISIKEKYLKTKNLIEFYFFRFFLWCISIKTWKYKHRFLLENLIRNCRWSQRLINLPTGTNGLIYMLNLHFVRMQDVTRRHTFPSPCTHQTVDPPTAYPADQLYQQKPLFTTMKGICSWKMVPSNL